MSGARDGVRQRAGDGAVDRGPSLVLPDNLERRGLIDGAPTDDRRARGIHLTRPGRDLAKRAAKVGGEIQARLLANVPPAELLACQHVLASIERDLEERLEIAAPAAD
jgi:DNA-binding MarR family transcriptional regulator